MRDSFQYIAPISRILGKDLAYTGAVVGILADNSLKAESAGRIVEYCTNKTSYSRQRRLDDCPSAEINKAYKDGRE